MPVLNVPVAWPVMPPLYWLACVFAAVSLVRVASAATALPAARPAGWRSTGLWALAAVAAAWAGGAAGGSVRWLVGAVPFGWKSLAVVGALAALAVYAMAAAGRSAASRGRLAGLAAHSALLAGGAVFALPFAWLLVTSFKEDVDMASPHGIVWVPRVRQTVPYLGPENPLYEAEFQGQRVEANVAVVLPDGRWQMAVERPGSLSGFSFEVPAGSLRQIPRQIELVTLRGGDGSLAKAVDELPDGRRVVEFVEGPAQGGRQTVPRSDAQPVRPPGLRWQNYTEALELLPQEARMGLTYLRNSMFLVVTNLLATLASCSLVAYAFARLRFPGRNLLFGVLLATMMLPGAVTLLPQFLIFRQLGWVDTLHPLWVPSLFASAFNVFMLRQFFKQVPLELEDAAKIDGCSYLRSFWSVLLPQVKPALAVIGVWTFLGAWNNFMGPLIYINSPENMPVAYALQLFHGERGGEPGLLMAFATMSMAPVLLLFVFAQRFFIEGVTLSGLGGR